MGINVIIRGVLGIFFTGLIFLGMMPTLYEFTHSDVMWENVQDERALNIRDIIWTMYLSLGIIVLFAIMAWMINASTRKTASTAYE